MLSSERPMSSASPELLMPSSLLARRVTRLAALPRDLAAAVAAIETMARDDLARIATALDDSAVTA